MSSLGFMTIISSMVSMGHVGLSAAIPTLGTVIGHARLVPTILLNHHPGLGACHRANTDPKLLHGMLRSSLWGQNAAPSRFLLTGYIPDHQQICMVADLIREWKQQDPHHVFVCDPVMGDTHTGLYIPQEAANALCEKLIPLAEHVTPNEFEYHLIKEHINDNCKVALTSEHEDKQVVAKLLHGEDILARMSAPLQTNAPHGLGDVFSAAYTKMLFLGSTATDAFQHAFVKSQDILSHSQKGPHLCFDSYTA